MTVYSLWWRFSNKAWLHEIKIHETDKNVVIDRGKLVSESGYKDVQLSKVTEVPFSFISIYLSQLFADSCQQFLISKTNLWSISSHFHNIAKISQKFQIFRVVKYLFM